MYTNLRKNIIAICAAISLSLLSGFTITAEELTDNGKFYPTEKGKPSKRQAGIVYKSDNFWDKYDLLAMKLIFQGEFGEIPKLPRFKDDYLKFVEVNSMLCGDSIPSNHFEITTTSQRVHMVGGMESYRDETVSITIKMENRFKNKYLEYKNDRERNLMEDNAIKRSFFQRFKMSKLSLEKPHKSYFESGSKGLNRHFNATNRHQIMGRFFREVTCQSATLYQMKENLWRAAHGQLSLQADKIKILNAVQESISEEKAALEVTFYDSCLKYYNLKPESEDYFCRCFDNTTREVMEGNERDYYSADFGRFFTDVGGKKLSPEDSLWRLQLPLKYCKAQAFNMHMDDEARSPQRQREREQRKKAEQLRAKEKEKARTEEYAKARAEEIARQEAAREEQRLENERKAEARKETQKKNEEYSAAIQALVKQREEKLSELNREYREQLGAPPRRNLNGDNYISREERKKQAVAYAEARKNKQQAPMSRKEARAAGLEYAEARKKVEIEYQEAKAKLLKEKQ